MGECLPSVNVSTEELVKRDEEEEEEEEGGRRRKEEEECRTRINYREISVFIQVVRTRQIQG